jgi:hypothetical protein
MPGYIAGEKIKDNCWTVNFNHHKIILGSQTSM